jgi:hypothetical protein
VDDVRFHGRKAYLTHVERWFDMPPVGGTAMDADGTLNFTDSTGPVR